MIKLLGEKTNSSVRSQKLKQIVKFVDKKRTIKKVSLYEFDRSLKQCIAKKETTAVCYVNKYLLNFFNLLKRTGFIQAYYLVPSAIFKSFLRYGFKPIFHNRVVIIFFTQRLYEGRFYLPNITIISRPSRQIFITYQKLLELSHLHSTTTTFFINTTFGLITHAEALQKKIGGNLICIIK